jgi:elongation factor 1-beta
MKKAPDGDLFHAVRWYTHINSFSETERKAFAASAKKLEAATSAPAKKVEDDDDEVDLFGDDDEEDQAEQERIKAERVAAYEAKKSKKPALIAKSSVMLDVKPWDDETDMKALEASVRSIEMDGLLWGSSKLVTIAFGIKKLQITCVVEDDKVGLFAFPFPVWFYYKKKESCL